MPTVAPSTVLSHTTTLTPIAPEDLRNAKTRLGYDYWCGLRGMRRFPSREELNPRNIASALTNMAILKVIDCGRDFQFRIVGDHAGCSYPIGLANRCFSELAADLPRAVEHWFGIYGQVVESREPLAIVVQIGRDAKEAKYLEAEAVFLPLGVRDNEVDHIVTFVKHTARV